MRVEWLAVSTVAMLLAGCVSPDRASLDSPAAPAAGEDWAFRDDTVDLSYNASVLRAQVTGDHVAFVIEINDTVSLGPLSLLIEGPVDPAEGAPRAFSWDFLPLDDPNAVPISWGLLNTGEFGGAEVRSGPVAVEYTVTDPQHDLFPSDVSGLEAKTGEFGALEPGRWLVVIGWSNLESMKLVVDPFPAARLLGTPTTKEGCGMILQSDMDGPLTATTSVAVGPHIEIDSRATLETSESLLFNSFIGPYIADWHLRVDGPNQTWNAGPDDREDFPFFGSGFLSHEPGTHTVAQRYVGTGFPLVHYYCDFGMPVEV